MLFLLLSALSPTVTIDLTESLNRMIYFCGCWTIVSSLIDSKFPEGRGHICSHTNTHQPRTVLLLLALHSCATKWDSPPLKKHTQKSLSLTPCCSERVRFLFATMEVKQCPAGWVSSERLLIVTGRRGTCPKHRLEQK